MDWAEDCDPELKQFSFVFLILLRHVKNDQDLESIILEQHGKLKAMRVTLGEMRTICQQNHEGHIMFLFDGIDEYSSGTNRYIDDILLNGKDNTFIISSSRPGDFLQPIRQQSDAEVVISGFSYENIHKCAALYIEDQQKCDSFFAQAKDSGLFPLLYIPIILLMACAVFMENECLPKNVTDLFGKIIRMSISRTTLKTTRKSAKQIENLDELMEKLGKLAWKALAKETMQLLISKVKYLVRENFPFYLESTKRFHSKMLVCANQPIHAILKLPILL